MTEINIKQTPSFSKISAHQESTPSHLGFAIFVIVSLGCASTMGVGISGLVNLIPILNSTYSIAIIVTGGASSFINLTLYLCTGRDPSPSQLPSSVRPLSQETEETFNSSPNNSSAQSLSLPPLLLTELEISTCQQEGVTLALPKPVHDYRLTGINRRSIPPPHMPIEKSSYSPDPQIMHFFMADFVGGGEGRGLVNAVQFYAHYLQHYCLLFPKAEKAQEILKVLTHHFLNLSIQENASSSAGQILERLKKDRYVAFPGGVYHTEAGHATFNELFLDAKDRVTLKITNSGDGLRFHPKSDFTLNATQQRESYRTLIFSGASLQQLQESQFLELIISFDKPCSSEILEEKLPKFSTHTTLQTSDLYPFLCHCWPGSSEIHAENPGGLQRGDSCSTQSLIKWMRGRYGTQSHKYLQMNFWIKLASFQDYLWNEKEPSSAFIYDALRAISGQASKLESLGLLSPTLFQNIRELYALAKIRALEASREEIERAEKQALCFSEGIDLSQAEKIMRNPQNTSDIIETRSTFEYTFSFPGEKLPYHLLPQLAKPYTVPLNDEMCFRLNFLRLLPDFDTFNFEQETHLDQPEVFKNYVAGKRYQSWQDYAADSYLHNAVTAGDTLALSTYIAVADPKINLWIRFSNWLVELEAFLKSASNEQLKQFVRLEFFSQLALACQRFFYTSAEGSFSMHISASFFTDKLNAWLIVYQEALKGEKIPPEVLLEWMLGLDLLLLSYKPEYTLSRIESNHRFRKIVDFVANEKQRLGKILGPNYLAPRNYWTIKDKKSKETNYWAPFSTNGIGRIKKWEDVPEMARFSRKILPKINEHIKDDEKLKATLSFGHRLYSIPYYDFLREGLTALFFFADRHQYCTQKSSFTKNISSAIQIDPHDEAFEYPNSLSMGVWFYTHSRRPGVSASPTYYPEFCIPSESQKYKAHRDLNSRIKTCFTRSQQALPFFTIEEENAYLTFVEHEPATRLTETLKFFEKRIEKFVDPQYQSAFEAALWGPEGASLLEKLFESASHQESAAVKLLFHFAESGVTSLLKKGPSAQPAAAYLLQLYFRLCYMSDHYAHKESSERIETLFNHWQHLFEVGRVNGKLGKALLGKALSEAVFTALPDIESSLLLRSDPRLVPFLAKTLLLECSISSALTSRHHPLVAHYGYLSFLALLGRTAQPNEIWQRALNEVFTEGKAKNSTPCHWNRARDILEWGKVTIYLSSRTMDEQNDSSLQLLPQEVLNDENYKKIFGEKRFLAHLHKERKRDIYLFEYSSQNYKLILDHLKNLQIYKKFGQTFFRLAEGSILLNLNYNHIFFNKKDIFWAADEKIYVEDSNKGRGVAYGDAEGMHRVKKNETLPLLLAQFKPKNNPLYTLFLRIESANQILVWLDKASQQISSIELPRLGLSFTAEVREGVNYLYCNEHPGFFIAKNQHMRFLKHFEYTLLLENRAGQKKIIVPISKIEQKAYEPYKLSRQNLSLISENPKPELFILDFEPHQKSPEFSSLLNQSSSILMLLQIYLTTQQYKSAFQLLKTTSLTEIRKLSKEEWEILRWNFESKDQHPHAIALRLHLYDWEFYLEKRAGRSFRIGQQFQADFSRYQEIRNHVGNYKISELQFNRLHQIYGSSHPKQELIPDLLHFANTYSEVGEVWKIREALGNGSKNSALSPTSFAQPGQEFLLNFLPYYGIAKGNNNQAQKELKRLLAASYKSNHDEIQFFRQLLLFAFFENSPSFEEMCDLFTKTEIEEQKFKAELRKIYNNAFEALKNKKISIREWCGLGSSPITFIKSDEVKKSIPLPNPTYSTPTTLTATHLLAFKGAEKISIPDQSIICAGPTATERLETLNQAALEVERWSASQTQLPLEKSATQDVPKKNSSLLAGEFQRIQEGVLLCKQEMQKSASKKAESLSTDLGEIKKVLNDYKEKMSQLSEPLDQLKESILKQANETSDNRGVTLEFMGELRPKLTLPILLLALGRGDLESIFNANPSLTVSAIEQMMSAVASYALLESQAQQLSRTASSLESYYNLLEKEPQSKNLPLLSQEYFTHRDAERPYDPKVYPQILVFEVLNNLVIRADQFNALCELTDLREGWKLFEAPTGFGKTAVLAMLWLILTAQTEDAAIMVIPKVLFENQEKIYQKKLYNCCKFFGLHLDYSRDSECTAEEISAIHNSIVEAQKNRRPIFMHDQTAHNLFVLKVKESAYESQPTSIHSALEAQLALRRYLKTSAVLFVDEPHKVLDDSEESNYSLGMAQFFPEKRLLLTLRIYSTLFTLLKDRYRLECWKESSQAHLPLLSHSLYQQEILEELVLALIEQGYIKSVDVDAQRYLLGKMETRERITFEKELKQKDLRIAYDLLHHYLPQTLQENANEHYGCLNAEESREGVPLDSARNPRKDNEYCSSDQILNFTIQANLATPFSLNFVRKFFNELYVAATKEIEEDKGLSETKSYQKFLLLTQRMPHPPKNFAKLTYLDLERMHQHINEEALTRLQFMGLTVLTQLRRYEKKIVSTPHLFVNCFKKVVGASGTLSKQNLPYRLKIQEDKKAIARTLITLSQKYLEAGSPTILELDKFLDKFLDNLKDLEGIKALPAAALKAGLKSPSVFIEIGAALRDYPSLKRAAQTLLEVFAEFEGLATFDQKGSCVVLKRGSKHFIPKHLAGIKEEKLFWLFAQKDTTGTDSKLPPDAEALIPINEHTTLTDLIQGVGRMRGIHAGQNARLFVDRDAAQIIRTKLEKESSEELTLFDLFTYCVQKEAEFKGAANIHSLTLQWNALLENTFWDTAIDSDNTQQFVKDFSELSELLLIEDTRDLPLKRPSLAAEPIDQEEALSILAKNFETKRKDIELKLTRAHSPHREKFSKEAFKERVKHIQHSMRYPEKVLLNANAHTTQTTQAESTSTKLTAQNILLNVQGEQQSEQNAQQSVESTSTSWLAKNISSKTPLEYSPQVEGYPIEQIFAHPELKDYLPLFQSASLKVAKNSFMTFEGDSLLTPGWVNGYVKPLNYIWLDATDLQSYMLCDEADAAQLIKSGARGTLWLVNQGVYLSTEGRDRNSLLADPKFRNREIEAKILQGDLYFSEVQWEDFQNLYASQKELLLQFVSKQLLPMYPALVNAPEYERVLQFLKT